MGDPENPAGAAAPPTFVGPYRIDREIGRGGMGVVYAARDTRLRRTVALKVLPPALALSGHLLARFRREATAAARLEHPGLCTVYDTGEADGAHFIAMRFVEGRSLDAVLADHAARGRPGRAVVGDSCRIVEKVARTLHIAHEAGLVHRDVKPSNIMVDGNGEPVLLDFGLACHRDAGETTRLTRTGTVMGTPAYMSPEQVRGDAAAVDRRTDVYALGVTLFEAITLRLPFEAESVPALYADILNAEPPDPAALNGDLPRDLRVIVLTALRKDPAQRYATALEMAEDLRRLRQGEPIRARPVSAVTRGIRWARRRRAAVLGAAGAAGLLAAAAAMAARPAGPPVGRTLPAIGRTAAEALPATGLRADAVPGDAVVAGSVLFVSEPDPTGGPSPPGVAVLLAPSAGRAIDLVGFGPDGAVRWTASQDGGPAWSAMADRAGLEPLQRGLRCLVTRGASAGAPAEESILLLATWSDRGAATIVDPLTGRARGTVFHHGAFAGDGSEWTSGVDVLPPDATGRRSIVLAGRHVDGREVAPCVTVIDADARRVQHVRLPVLPSPLSVAGPRDHGMRSLRVEWTPDAPSIILRTLESIWVRVPVADGRLVVSEASAFAGDDVSQAYDERHGTPGAYAAVVKERFGDPASLAAALRAGVREDNASLATGWVDR